MTKKIDYNFSVDGFYDSVNYYRSESPFDPSNMPTPTAAGITELLYSDITAEANKKYYVRFGSIKNATEKLSEEIVILTGGTIATARYWRFLFTETNGSPYLSIAEIFLISGSADIITIGKSYDYKSKNSGRGADACFDGIINSSDYFYVLASRLPVWISIDMGEPCSVDRIDIALSAISADASEAPKSFEVQKSDDGINWTTVKAFANQTNWILGVRRQFSL